MVGLELVVHRFVIGRSVRTSLARCLAAAGLAITISLSPLPGPLSAQDDQAGDSGKTQVSPDDLTRLESLATTPAPSASTDESRARFCQAQIERFRLASDLASRTADADTRRLIVQHQFESLRLLVQQQQPNAMNQLWDLSQTLIGDPDSELSRLAARYTRIIRLQRLLDGDRLQAPGLHDELVHWMESEPATRSMIEFVMQAASGLEKAERYQLAISLYDAAGQRLSTLQSETPVDDLVGRVDDARRRLSLIGKVLEVGGQTIDGATLTAEPLKGKIVLLDFWASWCIPCRQEMPEIRRLLDRYGDRGFAVVGVCVDEDRDAAQKYLTQSKDVNWPILMENEPSRIGLMHPLAQTAGVTQLPTAILLDRQGRVISAAARGANLERWLALLMDEMGSRRSPLQPDGLMMTRGQLPAVALPKKQ
jgi:thiol-disulfide isomerase/thioredoxin